MEKTGVVFSLIKKRLAEFTSHARNNVAVILFGLKSCVPVLPGKMNPGVVKVLARVISSPKNTDKIYDEAFSRIALNYGLAFKTK